jgi:penicillin amidase
MLRWIKWSGIILSALLAIMLIAGAVLVNGTLGLQQAQVSSSDLSGTVRVELDDFGVPLIKADKREDAAWVTGFIHAQERYFQMDLLRRRGAGELSALFGKRALSTDVKTRAHQFRQRAKRQLSLMPSAHQQLLASYVKGVNAGLDGLSFKPIEYWLLQKQPLAWTAEDSLLVVYAMYFGLEDGYAEKEFMRTLLHQQFPKAYEVLLPNRSSWDAPAFVGSTVKSVVKSAAETAQIDFSALNEARLSLKTAQINPIDSPAEQLLGTTENAPGSNSWAVSGKHTANGKAILSNDIHLGLYLPSQWYRLSLSVGQGADHYRVDGITLPGMPLIVAGSNGKVSWSLTNSYGDWSDLTQLAPGYTPQQTTLETIEYGNQSQQLTVKKTPWGPVVKTDDAGIDYAVQWIAHSERAINLNLVNFEQAQSVAQLLRLAPEVGMPPQNLIAVDDAGHIGWTIMGPIAQRDNNRFTTTAEYRQPWRWLPAQKYPRIYDPADGILFSANNRVYDGVNWPSIGEDDFLLGARAQQIKQGLKNLVESKFDTKLAAVANLQFDDRAVFLTRWYEKFAAVIEQYSAKDSPLRSLIQDWDGRASKISVSYTLVRAARAQVIADFYQPFISAVTDDPKTFKFRRINAHVEDTVFLALQQRQYQLFNTSDIDVYLHKVINAQYQSLMDEHQDLAKLRWGYQNRLDLKHPLGLKVFPLDQLLNVPQVEMVGDQFMPNIQEPRFGPSIRLVVSPGDEANGIVAMPGGQSGHPFSAFYDKGHEQWLNAQWLPLSGGKATRVLQFSPQ